MSETAKEKTCEDLVEQHLQSRVEDLQRFFEDEEAYEEFYEYGLSFDYVATRTFKGQTEGYFRYQISWGGPSEEFRFFVGYDHSLIRCEFWYLDWFDGARRTLGGSDLAVLTQVFEFFEECGSLEAEYTKATED